MIALRGLALDRKIEAKNAPFARAVKIEKFYERRLRQVAAAVGALIAGFDAENPDSVIYTTTALREYGRILEPWAGSVAWRMIKETAARDEFNWNTMAQKMGIALRAEIASAPTGAAMRQLLAEQIDLITSIPREAAQRVHDMAQEGIVQGTRPAAIAAKIYETEGVTKSRAMLIAHTEVSRAGTTLTRARAEFIGSEFFTWVTAGDSLVRPSHRVLNGRTFRWDDPPICDPPGYRALPGCIWRCRCIAIPVLSDS